MILIFYWQKNAEIAANTCMHLFRNIYVHLLRKTVTNITGYAKLVSGSFLLIEDCLEDLKVNERKQICYGGFIVCEKVTGF